MVTLPVHGFVQFWLHSVNKVFSVNYICMVTFIMICEFVTHSNAIMYYYGISSEFSTLSLFQCMFNQWLQINRFVSFGALCMNTSWKLRSNSQTYNIYLLHLWFNQHEIWWHDMKFKWMFSISHWIKWISMFKNLIKCSIRHVQTTTKMKSDQTTNEWGKHFLYM